MPMASRMARRNSAPKARSPVEYVRTTGIEGYRGTPGNLGAAVAVRDLDADRSEIVTLSWWTSLDAIRAFAGEPVDQARYYPSDDEYLLTRPTTVLHYESSDLYSSARSRVTGRKGRDGR